MADTRLFDLTAVTVLENTDVFYVIDTSDTADGGDGSSRKITKGNLFAAIEEDESGGADDNQDTLSLRFQGTGTKWSVGAAVAQQGFTIERAVDTGALAIAGGIDSDSGSALKLFGGTGPTGQEGDWNISVNGNTDAHKTMQWDESAGSLSLRSGAGAGVKVSNVTLTNDDMELGRTGTAGTLQYLIHHVDTDQNIQITGGSDAGLGANILIYGESHDTAADDMYFRANGNIWMSWDESSGQVVWFTGTGTKSAAGYFSSTGTFGLTGATATRATLNIPHGIAPSSPVDGDIWTTAAGGLYVQINGSTVGPLT